MQGWSHLSIRTKLTLVTMFACASALTLMSAGVVVNELVSARAQLTEQLQSIADVVGASSTAAVQFGDPAAANEALTALRGDPSIEAARIDLPDGQVLARYARPGAQSPAVTGWTGILTGGGSIVVSRPVLMQDATIGVLMVQGSLSRVTARLARYAGILAVVVATAGLVAYVLASLLQRRIAGPILRLSTTASRITADRDYAVRAAKESDDEIGQLVERFNDMLATIGQRTQELEQARDRLTDRTRSLELEIEERQRTEHALVLAKAAAEQASVAKSAFLANMSHELRTPLNAIIGYSEMVAEDAHARGQADSVADLEKITKAGRHLLALITDVLDISKIEAGRMELDVESFDGGLLVRAAVATSQTLATARDNALTVSGLDGIGTLRTDETKLQQVLLNLIGNACKFTHTGRVHVACRREASEAGDWLVIDVADTGVGMTPEQLGRIFQEFAQADASTTRRFGGTGLGLAISLRLCRLMGGAITVESAPGQGSTFTVRVPVEAPASLSAEPRHAQSGPRAEPASETPDTRALVVLVIDDDQSSADLLTRALGRAGIRTVVSSTPDDGLRQARSLRPDVVLMDLLMPEMHGWALLEAMKIDPALQDIPVIVQSVVDGRGRSLSLGAADHLTKPVAQDRLIEAVHSALATGRLMEAAR